MAVPIKLIFDHHITNKYTLASASLAFACSLSFNNIATPLTHNFSRSENQAIASTIALMPIKDEGEVYSPQIETIWETSNQPIKAQSSILATVVASDQRGMADPLDEDDFLYS